MANSTSHFSFGTKAILPDNFFSSSKNTTYSEPLFFKYPPNMGYNLGGYFKVKVHKRISLESGVSISNRKFSVRLEDTLGKLLGKSQFTFVSYEIPINMHIDLQVGKAEFMGAHLGMSADCFPSDIQLKNNLFEHITRPKFWILPAVNGGVAFHQLKPKGGFSIGFSYHRMLTIMAYNRTVYQPQTYNYRNISPLAGHYFSLDIKLILPQRKQKNEDKEMFIPNPLDF